MKNLLGSFVRRRRRYYRFTQSELAKHVHTTDATINNIERGTAHIPPHLLPRMAKILKFSIQKVVELQTKENRKKYLDEMEKHKPDPREPIPISARTLRLREKHALLVKTRTRDVLKRLAKAEEAKKKKPKREYYPR